MIGGNIIATLEKLTGAAKNAIGETVPAWKKYLDINGFLDYSTGEAKTSVYDAKVQESTHIFICDYVDLSGVKPESCRMLIKGEVYEVTLIDDPMELHKHLEIYLKYAGGQ